MRPLAKATAGILMAASPTLALAQATNGDGFAGARPPRFAAVPAPPGEVPGVSLAYGEPAAPADAPVPEPSGEGFRAWGQYVHTDARLGSDANGAGIRSSSDGLSVGVERAVDPALSLGLSFGYAEGMARSSGVRSDTTTYSGAGYLWWNPLGGLEVDALLGVTGLDVGVRRAVTLDGTPAVLNGRTGGIGLTALGAVGYRFAFDGPLGPSYLKPFASLSYGGQDRAGYAETAGAGGLSYTGRTFERSLLNLGAAAGVDVETPWGWTVRPEASLAWSRHLIDPSPLVPVLDIGTGRGFGLRDPRPGWDGLLVGAEISVGRRFGLQGFVGYGGEFRENATAHQVRVGLRTNW
jgi:outer membrane autotransporter protein